MELRLNIDTLYFGFSLLGFVLVFIPFPWHVRAKNTGTCLFMAWIGSACLVFSINSMLWNSRADNFAPIWCGISAKFSVGASTAISSVSLCINLRLWLIATDRVKVLEKRGMFLLEMFLGLVVPLADMGFQYIVQERWFNIYEGFGCRAVSANVLLTYLLLLAPQLFLGTVSVIVCILTLVAYHRMYKYMLDTQLSPTFHRQTTLSASFLWFLTLGGLAAALSIVYATFVVYLSASPSSNSDQFNHPFTMWKSWDSTHTNASAVTEYDEVEWRGNTMTELFLEADRWIFVGLALMFFFFFGFTSEARRRYRRLFGCGGRREWPSEWDSLGRELDRDFANGDSESAQRLNDLTTSSRQHTAFQAKSTLDKSLISQPRTVSLLTVLDDPFKLENPYPVHTYESNRAPANIIVTSTEYRKEIDPPAAFTSSTFGDTPFSSLLQPPPLSAASHISAASNTGSSTSLYSQMSVQESLVSIDSSSPLLPSPPLARVRPDGSHAPTFSVSSSSSVNQNSRGRSTGSGAINVQRPSSLRTRSSSRGRSASISSPPTGPLPDPPPEVPPTPTTVKGF
ncbi:hypothetical protein D9757_004784 [Collybiopsis confluens]|uniref:Pheromone receptor n=1 Tax=Collybiopsis confluens TaxID=2823264 RepID=A0A8H5HSV6_9AGAR|nr:hypothetical protein D9757_004784 [Collybiopsis confluens]